MVNPTDLDIDIQEEISSLFFDEGVEITCIINKSTPGAAAGDYDQVTMQYTNPSQAENAVPWFTTPLLAVNLQREDALLFTRAQENNAELSVSRIAGKVLIPSIRNDVQAPFYDQDNPSIAITEQDSIEILDSKYSIIAVNPIYSGELIGVWELLLANKQGKTISG